MAKPFVLLKLDKDYKFRVSNEAGYYYKQLTGKSLEQSLEGFGSADFNDIIYAGLKCINNDITLIEVLKLIDEHSDLDTIGKVVTEAMEQPNFFNSAKNQPKETHPAKK